MRPLEQSAIVQRRNENAKYLTSKIKDIPGISPHELYDGVTRCAYHLYPFRYKKEYFNSAPRQKFLVALSAEDIPYSGGYPRCAIPVGAVSGPVRLALFFQMVLCQMCFGVVMWHPFVLLRIHSTLLRTSLFSQP